MKTFATNPITILFCVKPHWSSNKSNVSELSQNIDVMYGCFFKPGMVTRIVFPSTRCHGRKFLPLLLFMNVYYRRNDYCYSKMTWNRLLYTDIFFYNSNIYLFVSNLHGQNHLHLLLLLYEWLLKVSSLSSVNLCIFESQTAQWFRTYLRQWESQFGSCLFIR